eukprot:scaffold477_cov35-Phaeocystis_antarctica.AAC.2
MRQEVARRQDRSRSRGGRASCSWVGAGSAPKVHAARSARWARIQQPDSRASVELHTATLQLPTFRHPGELLTQRRPEYATVPHSSLTLLTLRSSSAPPRRASPPPRPMGMITSYSSVASEASQSSLGRDCSARARPCMQWSHSTPRHTLHADTA